MRTVASGEAEAADEYRRATLVRGSRLGAAVAVVAAVLLATGSALGPVLLLGAAWIPIQAVILFESELLRATGRFRAASWWLSVRAVVAGVLGVIGAAAFGATGSVALQVGASAVVVGLLTARARWPRMAQHHRDELRSVGRPVTRQAFASYALGYADQYVLQPMRGPEAVGLYSIGYVLGQGVVEVAMTPIVAALTPRIIREVSQEDEHVARRTTRNAALLLLGLGGLAMLAVVAANALGLLRYLTPKGASPGQLALVTVLVAAATGLQGIVRLAYAVLLAHRATQAAARSFLITLGFAAVIVPTFIALGGVVGAALATLVATMLLATLMAWHARSLMRAATLPDAAAAAR